MKTLLVLTAGIAAFYFFLYRGFTDSQKLNFKIVLVYVSGVCLLLAVLMMVFSVKEASEYEKERTVAARMQNVQHILSRGEFSSLASQMQYSASYEADFEYVWERLEMYECCNCYLMYAQAAQNTQDAAYEKAAEEYRQKLLLLCGDPEYTENRDHGAYYLECAGMAAQE